MSKTEFFKFSCLERVNSVYLSNKGWNRSKESLAWYSYYCFEKGTVLPKKAAKKRSAAVSYLMSPTTI